MSVLAWVVAASVGAAPMAHVWPYRAKRAANGVVEYSYDLSALKLGGGSADAKAVHGEASVAAFLKTLPREVKVKVHPGAVTIAAGRGLEPNPLAPAFSLASDGPLEVDNPLAHKPRSRLRPPFDPNEPKVLVGAEMVLWQVRLLEESSLAAVEVDTEGLRRELLAKVTDRALAKFKESEGDVREGALALAARLIAANSCLDRTRIPAAVRAQSELQPAVEAEMQKRLADPDATAAPLPWVSSPELTCGWVRTRALGQPFENSRAGTSAVLLFLEALEADPQLAATWERIRLRRDRFVGRPADERVLQWRAAVGANAGKALEGLSEFIEGLPLNQRTPPGLIASPLTAFARFMAELHGPERLSMVDELAVAVQDARVVPLQSSWPDARERALVPFVATESITGVQFDASWRDRLVKAFATLQGLHHDERTNEVEPVVETSERSMLKVRLQLPPLLEVEPLAQVYERAASSLEQLVSALAAENLTGLKAVGIDGRPWPQTIVTEAKRLKSVLRGLVKLASPDAAVVLEGSEVTAARRFLTNWRTDPTLTRDVRVATQAALSAGATRAHSAVLGVGRRELVVGFATKPNVEFEGPTQSFELNANAEQRYIVPVLVSASVNVTPLTKVIDRSVIKALVDRAGRDRIKSEGAFVEALSAAQ